MTNLATIAIVGPTAVGKSALAHEVALRDSRVELVSLDAMCVYRGMDLATAKPSVTQRHEVSYHLIDVVDPWEEYSVRRHQILAKKALELITQRGHQAIYVGGTGLYARAVLDDFDVPARYPEVRHELERLAESDLSVLFDELCELDPLAASRMERTNARRIIRALEVTRGSGRPFSSFGDGLSTYASNRVGYVGLRRDWAELDIRIEQRFRQWIEEGFVREVEKLLQNAGGLSPTARQALGYREILEHLEQGRDLEECVSEAIARTRRFARRQRSWFTRDPRIEWFDDVNDASRRIDSMLAQARLCVRD